ncbi:hypothetical protein [Blastococcus sp. PRF04-17]|uniref:hypothetical protein n=1 Tax=Blastococcus sp. PRF04-17 TaxID=2933797 RepID=UPI001FF59291|nr:hypothetical protein [Blastococcus sp. PRF04-17]UOY03413.1 hypothetical protein MVA48_08815 [Blastococcus sp. PRF04-17]
MSGAPGGPPSDEARWAEAQSLLDRTPTESAEERLRRWRVLTLLFVLGVGLAALVLGLVVVLLVDGGVARPDDGPLWRELLGLGVILVAFVLVVVGFVLQLRGHRRLHAWRNPLAPLTRAQRKELADQVRAGSAEPADRLPLARYTAELLVHQRTAMTGQVGMLLLFAGQWIASPRALPLALASVFALLVVLSATIFRRQVRRARDFLDAHPAPDRSAR